MTAAGDAPGSQPFPWTEVTAFALGRLGWTPDSFWRATPREVAAALRGRLGVAGDARPDVAALRALLAAHPDDCARSAHDER